MKKANISRKSIIIAVAIVVIFLAILGIFIYEKNKPETLAKEVLTKNYGATLLDYENLINALSQSLTNTSTQNLTNGLIQNLEADENAKDYLYTVYGEQLTENGYEIFLKNRIPFIATLTAYEENSDLIVSSVKLKSQDALEGSKRYFFTIEAYTKEDESKIFTFKGYITLVQENDQWKVDYVAPYNK